MVVVMASSATTVIAGTVPRCAAIDPSALPDPANCQRRFASAGQTALYELADAQIKAGKFGDAGEALACAAAQIDGESDWRGQYEVIRRHGIIEYKQNKVAYALTRFECALNIAQSNDDRPAIAKQLKNIGSSLRRIGDYDTALDVLTRSLDIQRADHDAAVGPVLNNIADVYRESGRPVEAERYYREALEAFRRDKNIVESMHVFDSLSELAFDRGDPAAATKLLETALQDLRHADARHYQLNVYAGLARAAMLRNEVGDARRYSAEGLALAEKNSMPIPTDLQLQTARVDRLSGRFEPALARLRAVLAQQPEGNAPRAALLRELATTLEETGRDAEAINLLRQAQELELRDVREQSSQRLGWLQERFEAAERERTISALLDQNRHRTLVLWLMALSAFAALLLLGVFFLRRQQRMRLVEAAKEARYEEMLLNYRRQADALAEDRHLLQTLLDSRNDALCLLDGEGQVLAANRAAGVLLGIDHEALAGVQLSERFADIDAPAIKAALLNMEDAQSQTLALVARDGESALSAELLQWEYGNGLMVLHLREASATAAQNGGEPVTTPTVPTRTADADIPVQVRHDGDARTEFRRALVGLMLSVVDAWERSTGHSRIELAERSRIWRVNIDDGRLRARAMERYFSVSKLPQNPRWRDVLRSAYFVLAQCQLDTPLRIELQGQVDAVLAYTRRGAFV